MRLNEAQASVFHWNEMKKLKHDIVRNEVNMNKVPIPVFDLLNKSDLHSFNLLSTFHREAIIYIQDQQ